MAATKSEMKDKRKIKWVAKDIRKQVGCSKKGVNEEIKLMLFR